jgi:hypothetical protein
MKVIQAKLYFVILMLVVLYLHPTTSFTTGIFSCGLQGTYKVYPTSVVGSSCVQYTNGSAAVGIPPCANGECSSPNGNVHSAVFVSALGGSGTLILAGTFTSVYVAEQSLFSFGEGGCLLRRCNPATVDSSLSLESQQRTRRRGSHDGPFSPV